MSAVKSAEGALLPPRPRRQDGTLRRVGIELEMQGIELPKLAGLVASHFGGTASPLGRYEYQIDGDPAGAWRVELDFEYLKRRGRQAFGDGLLAQLDEAAEELLATGSQALVPAEVVSPPLPMDRIADTDTLIAELRDAGARGTRDGLVFAFGLHLNPEMPDTEAATVTAYLKAFLCLFDWLRMRARVDLLRRLTPYIDAFPADYVRHVMAPGYQPGIEDLIDDYLQANATRNRALDLLPLFAHLDEPRVRASIDDPRIKPRPALHYRLPNCEIDEPGWGVRQSWQDWLQVECMAADPARLNAACEAYAAFLGNPLERLLESWAEGVEPWLCDPADR